MLKVKLQLELNFMERTLNFVKKNKYLLIIKPTFVQLTMIAICSRLCNYLENQKETSLLAFRIDIMSP